MKKSLFTLFFAFYSFFNASSQSNNLLVDFINKNDLILRGVHKQMYYDAAAKDEQLFKRLITAQLIAVKLAPSDIQKSSQYAFLVRNESIAFMKKYTKNNLDYFTISNDENNSLHLYKPEKIESKILDDSIIQDIQVLKVSDMNIFNIFNTSIR
jgi:hypothetical protein